MGDLVGGEMVVHWTHGLGGWGMFGGKRKAEEGAALDARLVDTW